jgi:ankyrin repeat protein
MLAFVLVFFQEPQSGVIPLVSIGYPKIASTRIDMQVSLFKHPVAISMLISLLIVSSASGQNLADAAKAGNLADIKDLVGKGADINAAKNYSGASALCLAASEGHKDVVNFLIAKKADVHISTRDGYTPLMAAASQGWNDIVSLLIEKGADVNAQSKHGFTALMMAVWAGHAETIELLVHHGANINTIPYKGICALMVAIKVGNQRLIPVLIRLGADANPSFEKSPSHPLLGAIRSTEFGTEESGNSLLNGHKDIFKLFFMRRHTLKDFTRCQTPLAAAASRGWPEAVASLIANGAEIRVYDRLGGSALMAAAKSGKPEVVKIFLEKGAEVNAIDCQGNSPLSLAAASGNLDAVELLIGAGADLNPEINGIPENLNAVCKRYPRPKHLANPLIAATSRGLTNVVELLIASGADVNAHDRVGGTALMAAAESGHPELVKVFIDKGLDVNGIDRQGNTPLSLAAAKGDLAAVKLLVGAGADTAPQNKFVYTAHHAEPGRSHSVRKAKNPLNQIFYPGMRKSARIRDCEATAIYLLQEGASIQPKEIYGYQDSQEPFLTMALSYGRLELGKYLIGKGANVNARYNNDSLLYSLMVKHLGSEDFPAFDTIRLLCENGADLEYRDRWGRTLLMVMAKAGKFEILKFLLTYNADVNALNTLEKNPLKPVTALGFAVDGGYLPAVEYLLEKGADVNKAVEKGATPLWFSVSHNNMEITQLLLDRGAQVNAKWQNPMRCCLLNRNIELARLLLRHGADMRSGFLDGVLVESIGKKELKIAMFMIENEADLNARSENEKSSPLMAAILTDQPELAVLLINKGADVNATDNRGCTPLMFAAQKGDLQTSKALLQNGADVNPQTPDGYTAYIIAVNKKHQSIANLLKKHGGNTEAAEKYFATLKFLKKYSNEGKNSDQKPPSPAELNYYMSVMSSKLGIKDFLSWKPDPIFSSPEKTWEVYKNALSAYDMDLAIRCHAADTKIRYKEILTALGPDKTKTLVKEMKSIKRISGDMNSAKYMLTAKQNSKMISYAVYFTNYFGEWKIEFY